LSAFCGAWIEQELRLSYTARLVENHTRFSEGSWMSVAHPTSLTGVRRPHVPFGTQLLSHLDGDDHLQPDVCVLSPVAPPGAALSWRVPPGSIRLRSASLWPTADPNNLRSLVAHEVAHYFGLDERMHSSCSTSDTIMTPGPCYSSIPAPFPTGPTASDIEAMVRSTRGNNHRKVCGWS
jgi:hypothetical protein